MTTLAEQPAELDTPAPGRRFLGEISGRRERELRARQAAVKAL